MYWARCKLSLASPRSKETMPDIEEGKQVVTVGRSEPIAAGQATMANSLPVAIASDQSPVPILDNLSAPSEVHDDCWAIHEFKAVFSFGIARTSLLLIQKLGRLLPTIPALLITPRSRTCLLKVVLSCWLIPMQPTIRRLRCRAVWCSLIRPAASLT